MFPNKQQAKHWIEGTEYKVIKENFEHFRKLKFCPRTLREGLYLRPNIKFAWMPTFQILDNKTSMETKSTKSSCNYCDLQNRTLPGKS